MYAITELDGHPHVVSVYDSGVLDDGHPYLVMQLCHGSLASRVSRGESMPVADVVDVGVKISEALVAAHGLGVLHRDIKPANILLSRYGEPLLSDFGIAAVLEASQGLSTTLGVGSPHYAPPEAFDRRPPVVQSDVYSLGVTLYALLAGEAPAFPKDQPPPDLPGVSGELMAVLRRSMMPDPADRYSALEFQAALAYTAMPATVTGDLATRRPRTSSQPRSSPRTSLQQPAFRP